VTLPPFEFGAVRSLCPRPQHFTDFAVDFGLIRDNSAELVASAIPGTNALLSHFYRTRRPRERHGDLQSPMCREDKSTKRRGILTARLCEWSG
jgi:hypothetical protein